METHPKRPAAAPSRRPVRARVHAPAGDTEAEAEAASKPFLRFYHTESLRKKTIAVLTLIEQADDATAHRAALSAVVVELMTSGMSYYFMQPLKLAKVGFIVQQTAKLGMAGTQQVMGSVIHKIIGLMDTQQLQSVCASIRRFMR